MSYKDMDNFFHYASLYFHPGGYEIPKGTQVLINLPALHRNPKLWDNPTEFRPERHIDEAGNLTKSPYLLPFSTGRRQCVGESLAKMDLHVITATLLQRFNFYPEPGQKVDLSCVENVLAYVAKDNKLVVKER